MKQPHKHAEFIKAWADDPSIKFEFKLPNGAWFPIMGQPAWSLHDEYRIKPEPKPDVVRDIFIIDSIAMWGLPENNLRLTFSGETGELIKAEVLK